MCFFIYESKAQSLEEDVCVYKKAIIGTWIAEEDPSHKIEFTSEGIFKVYIDNKLEKDISKYFISESCGVNTDSLYLKIFIATDDYVCDSINNIHTDENGITTLSLTTFRGRLEIYRKE